MKVGVRDAAGGLLQVDEQRGDGIGDRGTPGMEDTMGAFSHSLDLEIFGEVRGASSLHFYKANWGLGGIPYIWRNSALACSRSLPEGLFGFQAMRRIVL